MEATINGLERSTAGGATSSYSSVEASSYNNGSPEAGENIPHVAVFLSCGHFCEYGFEDGQRGRCCGCNRASEPCPLCLRDVLDVAFQWMNRVHPENQTQEVMSTSQPVRTDLTSAQLAEQPPLLLQPSSPPSSSITSLNPTHTQLTQLPQISSRRLCKTGCGRNCAPGIYQPTGQPYDTCCRWCGQGRGHDHTCDASASAGKAQLQQNGHVPSNSGYPLPAQLPQYSRNRRCKNGCGRNCAPEICKRTNKPYDTCCRGCGNGRGHDHTCRG
jgi:hypothetical protein